MTSKLLINEHPLQVLPSLAEKVGLNEAIVIQQLHYWLSKSKGGIEHEGNRWIFNTYDEWQEQFPFWSISTIQRIFSKLEKSNIIVSKQIKKKQHDMTKYYRLDYDELIRLEHVKMTSSEDSKMESSKIAEQDDVNKNTETTSKTTTKKGDLLDGMIEFAKIGEEKEKEGKSWTGRESIPEPLRDLLDVFVKMTGMRPTKGQVIHWLGTAQDWMDLGANKFDVEMAVKKAKGDDKGNHGFSIGGPHSLTNTINAIAGERRTNGSGSSAFERALQDLGG